ncbi:MAG: hypothetical protein LRY66_07365 [Saccharospirillaceae bacterium]|nr:hypothetical protein [Saccharospirillaceae bacterium]MCD8531170.1 hypothetical protein [Saccharospirillaceae bacterium]
MTSLEIISVTKDIILIFAAIATAHVAINGLQSWSRELKGKADFEVARNLIRSAYKLRDELRYCRSPWVTMDEFPEDYDSNNKTPEIEAKAYAFIYSNRWKPVATALQNFETQALEAEALWGSEFKPKTDELRQCARNLQVALEADISNKASGGENFRCDPEFGKTIKSEIWATHDDKNDLTLKISHAINEIEKNIRPHFRRS